MLKKSEIARAYIKKFPKHGNRTIAGILCKEHPNLFLSIDNARSAVRYVRGNNGDRHRKRFLKNQTLERMVKQENIIFLNL